MRRNSFNGGPFLSLVIPENISMDAGQSSDVHTSAGDEEGETVEIKIKTLDAQSYTLRVDRNVSYDD